MKEKSTCVMKYVLNGDHGSGTIEENDTKTKDMWFLTSRGSESIQVTSVVSTMIKRSTESIAIQAQGNRT